MRVQTMLAAMFVCAMGVTAATESDAVEPSPTVSKQVILLVKDDALTLPANPETLINAVNAPQPNGVQAAIKSTLGNPIHASYAIKSNRLSSEVFALVPRDSPTYRLHRYVVLDYADLDAARRADEALRGHGAVLSVELNGILQYAYPNDTYFPETAPPGQPHTYQWGLHALEVPAAWDLTRGWGYVGVADNGIDISHPDLQNAFRPHLSLNFVSPTLSVNEIPTTPTYNVAGHGSHVAGIIAATTNNGTGVAGVCPNCSLLIGKIADASQDIRITAQTLGDSINTATAVGAQVINLSLGAFDPPPCSHSSMTFLCAALSQASVRDVVVVAAAGNQRCENKL